eukprot:321300-Prymnesium_polylepis.1
MLTYHRPADRRLPPRRWMIAYALSTELPPAADDTRPVDRAKPPAADDTRQHTRPQKDGPM